MLVSFYFSVEVSLREILCHVCARARTRAQLRALMTQKSCEAGMRKAILRNHLKRLLVNSTLVSFDFSRVQPEAYRNLTCR